MNNLVLVMVGTDHHPFNRLVDWVDEAARRHPDVRFVVQHGESKAPVVAEGHAYLTHLEIRELLASAAAAVCHGGPGTIMDARNTGHVPVCVPRDPAFGEHVDGHQQRFAALVDRAGVVVRAETEPEFHTALDEALTHAGEERTSVVPISAATIAARTRLAQELDTLVAARHRRSRPLHRTPAPGRDGVA